MKISLVSIDSTGIVRILAEGEITSRDFDDPSKNPLETVLGAGWAANRVSMDLSKASFIDSRAIGWLMECQKRFKEKGGKLALHSPPARVSQVLDLLRMRQALNVVDNEAAAKTYLVGEAAGGAAAPK
jgi:anti-anti-sigma factor